MTEVRTLNLPEMCEGPFEFLSTDETLVLDAFKNFGVEFIVVGGYAVRVHGYLRTAVSDLDLLVQISTLNLEKLHAALDSIGIPKSRAIAEHFATKPNPILHLRGHDVDLIGAVESLRFEDVLPTVIEVEHAAFRLKVISKQRLIQIKEQALSRGGPGSKAEQDREDLAALKDTSRFGCHRVP